mgnify:FL=1
MTTEEVMFKNLEHKIRVWVVQQEKIAEIAHTHEAKDSERVLRHDESENAQLKVAV